MPDRIATTVRADGLDHRLVPPSVADARGRVFMETVAAAIERSDPNDLRFTDFERVDARLLPLFVRQLSLQRFMFPGITEEIVRRFCARAAEIHELSGSLPGIRFALELVGMTLDWEDWHEANPLGQPDTYEATVWANEHIAPDEPSILNPKTIAAATAMIDGQKRWSQEGPFRLGVAIDGAMAPVTTGQATATHRASGEARHETTRAADPAIATTGQALAVHRASGTAEHDTTREAQPAAVVSSTAIAIHRGSGTALAGREGRAPLAAIVASQSITIHCGTWRAR